MIDSFVLLAPVLLLLVVALLSFVGCELVFPLEPPQRKPQFRTNCGGPAIADTDIGWATDDDPNAAGTPNKGFPLANTGSPIDPNGNTPDRIYDTYRFGNPGFLYQFLLGQGDALVHLKFAQISDNPNLQGPFAFTIDGGDPVKITENSFDVVALAGGARKKFDYTGTVKVSAAGMLTITFSQATGQGNFPFVNAIQVDI